MLWFGSYHESNNSLKTGTAKPLRGSCGPLAQPLDSFRNIGKVMDDDDAEIKSSSLQLEKAVDDLSKIGGVKVSPPYCSFCRRGKGQYLFCVEGHSNVRICDNCVIKAHEMIMNEIKNEQ